MTMKPRMIEAAVAAERQAADVADKGFEATVSSLKDGMTKATAGFADTQAKVKEGMEKAMRTAEELVAFGQRSEAFRARCEKHCRVRQPHKRRLGDIPDHGRIRPGCSGITHDKTSRTARAT